MEKSKIDRINELAHLAKERELTSEELAERDALRKEYIEEFRRNLGAGKHLHRHPRRQEASPAAEAVKKQRLLYEAAVICTVLLTGS